MRRAVPHARRRHACAQRDERRPARSSRPAARACSPIRPPHYAVADGAARLRLRVPEPAHGAAAAARAVKQRTGEALLAAARSALRAAVRAAGHSASRCRSTRARQVFDAKHSNLHPLFRKDADSAAAGHHRRARRRAARRARSARVQVRHFSQAPSADDDRGRLRHPARLGEARARRRPRRQGPQDRPHLARDAAGRRRSPSPTTRRCSTTCSSTPAATSRSTASSRRGSRSSSPSCSAAAAGARGHAVPTCSRATDYVTPAVEIIDARIEQFDRDTKAPRKVFDTIADFAANAGIVTGGRPVRPRRGRPALGRRAALQERRDRGDRPGRRACSTTRPTASPGWPTRSRPTTSGSNAGDVVLGGSFTRPTPARARRRLHADYGPLGTIALRFT